MSKLVLTHATPGLTLREQADAAEIRALFNATPDERSRDLRRLRSKTEDLAYFLNNPRRYLGGNDHAQ